MSIGLKKKQEIRIRDVLQNHPEISKAILFGSRAKKTNRPGSDIDLALFGERITHKDFLRLKVELNELNLPYKFDPVIYSQISETGLKEHIDRVGVVFFESEKKLG